MPANHVNRREALGALAGTVLLPAFGDAANAAPRTVSIFFDFERFAATPLATRLVGELKGLIAKKSRVAITGHCDTAEPDISLARAAHVLGILFGLGVTREADFTVTGKGATEPRVNTGPNVREPRNRRVEVTVE